MTVPNTQPRTTLSEALSRILTAALLLLAAVAVLPLIAAVAVLFGLVLLARRLVDWWDTRREVPAAPVVSGSRIGGVWAPPKAVRR